MVAGEAGNTVSKTPSEPAAGAASPSEPAAGAASPLGDPGSILEIQFRRVVIMSALRMRKRSCMGGEPSTNSASWESTILVGPKVTRDESRSSSSVTTTSGRGGRALLLIHAATRFADREEASRRATLDRL